MELAAGRGANSLYLAKRNTETEFHGLDLPGGQLSGVKNNCSNFYPHFGDYHNLDEFKPNSFDLVFIIESLCYSNDKEKVLAQARKVLKPNGLLVVIDGYLNKNTDELSNDEILAVDVAQKGMLIENFENYDLFKAKVIKSGFKVIFEEDVSPLTLPTLRSFEKKADAFFCLPIFLSKLLIRALPHEFTNNVISAFLLVDLINLDVGNYIILVSKKG